MWDVARSAARIFLAQTSTSCFLKPSDATPASAVKLEATSTVANVPGPASAGSPKIGSAAGVTEDNSDVLADQEDRSKQNGDDDLCSKNAEAREAMRLQAEANLILSEVSSVFANKTYMHICQSFVVLFVSSSKFL